MLMLPGCMLALMEMMLVLLRGMLVLVGVPVRSSGFHDGSIFPHAYSLDLGSIFFLLISAHTLLGLQHSLYGYEPDNLELFLPCIVKLDINFKFGLNYRNEIV